MDWLTLQNDLEQRKNDLIMFLFTLDEILRSDIQIQIRYLQTNSETMKKSALCLTTNLFIHTKKLHSISTSHLPDQILAHSDYL